MILPILISVPHAGLSVPPEVEDICILTKDQIEKDGDEGASQIYDIGDEMTAFVTTNIARAFVDVNRAADDFSADGVVKTHTIYREFVYRRPLTDEQISQLLAGYYHFYHKKLTKYSTNVILGLDCHTMAAVGPPISKDAGQERPLICLSNANRTCPESWLDLMAKCLAESFGVEVSVNRPFVGGHIIRRHAKELPWMQLELSREDFIGVDEKRHCILKALPDWFRRLQDL